MTPKELAAQLNGSEYPFNLSATVEAEMRNLGLVVVFGAWDGLMEFEGAIYDEIGACHGAKVSVDARGLLTEFDYLCDEKDFSGLQDYFARLPGAKTIEAIPGAEGYSWTYKTDIPHETFDIMEDGEKYCRAIVFSLSDLAPKPAASTPPHPDVLNELRSAPVLDLENVL